MTLEQIGLLERGSFHLSGPHRGAGSLEEARFEPSAVADQVDWRSEARWGCPVLVRRGSLCLKTSPDHRRRGGGTRWRSFSRGTRRRTCGSATQRSVRNPLLPAPSPAVTLIFKKTAREAFRRGREACSAGRLQEAEADRCRNGKRASPADGTMRRYRPPGHPSNPSPRFSIPHFRSIFGSLSAQTFGARVLRGSDDRVSGWQGGSRHLIRGYVQPPLHDRGIVAAKPGRHPSPASLPRPSRVPVGSSAHYTWLAHHHHPPPLLEASLVGTIKMKRMI